MFFYVPWTIHKGDLRDLGQHLKTTEILCTVFNEDYTVAQDAQSKVLHIEDAAKSPLFNIYCLDIENDVELQHRCTGTLFSISRPSQFEGSSTTEYYRFRIQNSCFNEMIKCYSPQNLFLQRGCLPLEVQK